MVPTPAAGAALGTGAPAVAGFAPATARGESTVAAPAAVSFSNGTLTVTANNSSLEQILNDTAAKTGMNIEGDLPQDRIFGNFGPAPAADVLAQLLDGTGNNYVILGGGRNTAPRSLVITAATGVPLSGPGPVAAPVVAQMTPGEDDDDDEPAPPPPPPVQQPVPPPTPFKPQSQGGFGSSNGVRTPQQILEEMQQRRQQNQSGGTDEQQQ